MTIAEENDEFDEEDFDERLDIQKPKQRAIRI